MSPKEAGGLLRFVLHEHFAKHHHFDFRLERDGVLKSWAVPKGLPEKAGERRLAIAVEDHPEDYIGFEGTIPEGEYGAGEVKIADAGTYTTVTWSDTKIEVTLAGRRFSGTYVLVPFAKAGEGQWLVLKKG
ncbi:MAG: ATP-dependent DNA ligase [Methanoregula sp. PtaU1.Bin051]|nr:MAG: ATP-dependent DNA ligase [Methanoregula sp. PtaU1.Bin051]